MNEKNTKPEIIGIISDTHGYLSGSALEALKGVSLIVHAGDINTQKIYRQLQQIAPLIAVRGNTDSGSLQTELSFTEFVQIGEIKMYILHILEDLDLKPKAAGMDIVVYGHTHRPKISSKEGVLYINPGSASSPRHGGAPTLLKLMIKGKKIETEWVGLEFPKLF